MSSVVHYNICPRKKKSMGTSLLVSFICCFSFKKDHSSLNLVVSSAMGNLAMSSKEEEKGIEKIEEERKERDTGGWGKTRTRVQKQ